MGTRTRPAVTLYGGLQCLYCFFSVALRPNFGLGRFIFKVCRSQTAGSTLERVISWSQRPPPTQQTQEVNNHALSGIRARDPSNRASCKRAP